MLPFMARNLRVVSFLLFFALPTYAQPPAVVAVHALPPFAITDDTIKPGTKGLDVEKALASALKQQAPVKSEFDTNAEFSERLKKFAVRALPAQISDGGLFAVFQLASSSPPLRLGSGNPTTEIAYSPETEVLYVTLHSSLGCLPLRRVTTPKRKYTATNGFGQQVTVLEAAVSETCISISDTSPSPVKDISFAINISRGDAPKLKARLAFALIGKAVPPFAESRDYHDKPTMKQPLELRTRQRLLVMELVDVWLVDIGTGSVLAKHMTPLTNSKPSLVGGFSFTNGCRRPSYGKSEVPNSDLVVELAVSVKFDGSITETSVSRSTGIPSLDSRVVNAVSQCKFKPGTKDGQPIDGVAVVKFHFD